MKMTEQDIDRVALAKFVGFKEEPTARPGVHGEIPWRWPQGPLIYDFWDLPDFEKDLNAIRLVEEVIIAQQFGWTYLHLLAAEVGVEIPSLVHACCEARFKAAVACLKQTDLYPLKIKDISGEVQSARELSEGPHDDWTCHLDWKTIRSEGYDFVFFDGENYEYNKHGPVIQR